MRSSDEWVLGIDLGTSNTAAVTFGPSQPGPVSILHGRQRPVLPSVVSLKNPRLPIVGWLARDMMLTDPTTTIYGWKRFIGRSERSDYVSRNRERFPFQVHADPRGNLGAVVQDAVYPFKHIAALVLDQVRLQAEAALRTRVSSCVIAVPAHFSKAQRSAILDAARRAGLKVLRLVNEPTAAALAFGIDRRLDGKVLVFDLGGGTFDATILEVVDNVFDVRATRGDGFLGGIDFDRAIFQRLHEFCEARYRLDINRDPVVAQRVMNAAENAKCALSTETRVRINVPMLGHDGQGRTFDLDYVLDREELESMTAALVERCLGIVEQMMSDANVRPEDIHHVLAVGGQTRMPLVRRRISEIMGRPPLTHLDADTCVAHGAAIMARGDADPASAVLLDVLSVPVGVVFPGGRTQFIFRANCDLPAVQTLMLDPPPVGPRFRPRAVARRRYRLDRSPRSGGRSRSSEGFRSRRSLSTRLQHRRRPRHAGCLHVICPAGQSPARTAGKSGRASALIRAVHPTGRSDLPTVPTERDSSLSL